jgi:hypothetical protein
MKIEQDEHELERVATILQGRFSFVDEDGDRGYFIAEITQYEDDNERVLTNVVDIWWESMTREEKWLPKEEWIQKHWDSYYHVSDY